MELENPEIDELNKNHIARDDWMAIQNYKRDLHEIEEKQYQEQLKNDKIETREYLDKQKLDNAIKRINKKFEDIEYDEQILRDVENYYKEEAQKAIEKQMKKKYEKSVRINQIKEKRNEKRSDILKQIKYNKEFSN